MKISNSSLTNRRTSRLLYTQVMDNTTFRQTILENRKTIFDLFKTNDRLDRIEYLAEGDDNYIYKIWGKQAIYALRILKPTNKRIKQDYDFEFAFQNYLRRHAIPIPMPYLCKNNQPYATLDVGGAQLQLTLYEFVTGQTVTDPSVAQVQAVGTLLGKLHRLAATCHISYDRLEHVDALSWLEDASIKPTANDDLTQKAYVLYQEHAKYVKENLPAFTEVPLHNDIHFGNLLFDGDRIVAVLDFDESHKHYIPLELGWSTGKICNFGNLEDFKTNLKAFQKSYSQEYNEQVSSELEESVVNSALIAEVGRKFLKNPTDLMRGKDFKTSLICSTQATHC